MSLPNLLSLARALAMLCLTLFASACNSLPTIVPDMVPSKGEPVQLDGTHGPLSAERSKAILDRLSAGGDETNIFDLHLAVEEAIVGSPLSAGNKVELLQDGPNTYKAMLAAITAATDHINMETFILEDDEIGQRFAAELIVKQQEGVQVNLMYDSVGTLGTPKAFFKELADGGVDLLEFNPVNPVTAKAGWEVNQRDHRKLLIVDGRIAFLGGVNISSVYSGGSLSQSSKVRPGGELPWRDTHLQVEGPVVAELQQLFIDTWIQQKGEPLIPRNYLPLLEPKGNEVVRAIGSSPEEPYSLIYATLISALRSAQSEIWLTNAYFVPDPQLLTTLKEAVARGVDVRLVLPSSTDSWLVFHASRSNFSELLEAGVKLYERRGALLHVKTAVIDGVWSTVGSTNLDWRSFLHNYEVNAVVLGNDFGEQMRAAFKADQANSSEITLEQWRRRSILMRAKELIAQLWEYWL
ncbi:cardiolipin synthase [Pseudomonas taeanensis MS-3]|jgi:cardiolipin synthase|uniref:Cardiolipin synthase n=1 Tax=Pseudomonas taeanensis MS-3 TaxID=1395571 RepID=A0A0A1YGV2_9PSED|nr:cardiolipin synthase [Pseudomonas taeanensis]KFX68291.1 cardiolipin synthase [Pseudomonas taeanensis MS-3]